MAQVVLKQIIHISPINKTHKKFNNFQCSVFSIFLTVYSVFNFIKSDSSPNCHIYFSSSEKKFFYITLTVFF